MAQISPLFFIGIFCFVLPTLFNILNWHFGNWPYTVGIAFIIVGLIHTIWSNR